MSTSRTTERIDPRRQRAPRAWAAMLVALAALAAVVALMLYDGATVHDRGELDRVSFGWPLSWVTQHQLLDPPFPYDTSFLSPWQHPTSIDLRAFSLDLLLVALLLAAAWWGTATVTARRRGATDGHGTGT